MSNPILQLKKLTKTFSKGKVKALNEISLSLSKGKILAVVGESGSVKNYINSNNNRFRNTK